MTSAASGDGTRVPEGLLYTSDHEWLRAEEEEVVVGITDYAQDQLGDVVYFDLPEAGAAITAGERFGEIESVKTVSDLFAPVSGEVLAINDELEEHPELVNASPYEDGWILRVRVGDVAALDGLLSADDYRSRLPEG